MIERKPERVAAERYNLLVVGGGILGICALLEASRRGVSALLVERDDYGGATTWNSLNTIHGGLRYLQSLDFHRCFESIRERRWFLRHFPDQVVPLRCLMPLYSRGMKRPALFRAALALNTFLSTHWNIGVRADRRLRAGAVVDPEETASVYPAVERAGLRGGGVWYDATLVQPRRVVMEMLRWAIACGGRSLNYMEAMSIGTPDGSVPETECVDRLTGTRFTFRAKRVLNCAGPWCRSLAARFDKDHPDLFHPSIGVNLLIDRPPLSEAALAVAPERGGAQTYFLLPRDGRVIAGTLQFPADKIENPPRVSRERIESFLKELNEAAPGLCADPGSVVRVYAGYMPVRAEGKPDLATKVVRVDHGVGGGPRGVYSVSGVKFTTARAAAESAVRFALSGGSLDLSVRSGTDRPASGPAIALADVGEILNGEDDGVRNEIARLIDEESVVTMDDLLLRRTEWGVDPHESRAVAERVRTLLDWPEDPVSNTGCSARMNR